MPTIDYEGMKINVDDGGYLVNWEDWNEKVACALAEREGVAKEHVLDKEKMDILRYMRDYYKKYNAFPILRSVCKNVHQAAGCTRVQFPNPVEAWKIAGLPKPTSRVLAFLHPEE
jgi:TusE/DsrC/DsvC family sulfur relay protein